MADQRLETVICHQFALAEVWRALLRRRRGGFGRRMR